MIFWLSSSTGPSAAGDGLWRDALGSEVPLLLGWRLREWQVLFFYDPDGNLLEFDEHGAGAQNTHDFEWSTVNMDELVE